MQGRITARHLQDADRCSPGIASYYEQLSDKPATFLQLLWAFEGQQMLARSRKRCRR